MSAPLTIRHINDGPLVRWTPPMVEMVRALSQEGLGSGTIAKRMGLSRNAVIGARTRFNIAAPIRPKILRHCPDGFAEVGQTITIGAACKLYHASFKTVCRWHREAGTSPKKAPPFQPKKKEPKPPKARKARKARTWRLDPRLVAKAVPSRENSVAGAAQMHLQRFGPCFRAHIVDPQAANDQWVVLGRRMSEAEMLSIAARKGFQVAA